jgi:glycosyltransferase involved in cell wall biosynthesis
VRVLIASKILVVAAYRRKLDEIAAQPGVDRLVAVTGPSWREPGGRLLGLEPAPTANYELRVEPIRFNGNFHLFHWQHLGRVLREVRPDVVHLDEEPYNLATALGVRAARRVGARIVFFTWQNLLRRYPPPFNLFEKLAFRASSYAIAGNAEAVDVLRAKGYRGPTRVIPQFGIDPHLFAPGASPDGTPTIGFIARLVEEKGIFVLLDALARLDGEWRLHVVGSGPLKQRAEQRALGLGIGARITWEPGLASTRVPERMRQFTVLVQPSLTRRNWKEQFGRAVMEAMACGVPVVGSDSGEIPHVVADAGVVVREGDSLALRDALARLLHEPALREELGRRGRQRVLECFTHRRIAEQTVHVYRAALEPDRNR